jgi:large subunit ribosomal protein L22
MKAFLNNYRQSPRKVRLAAGLVKGKKVEEALVELDFLAKRSSSPLKKLLLSAIANAKNMGIDQENLYIKEFRIDKGVTMKRMMPAAMGSAHRINKRTSNITLILAERTETKKEVKKAEKKVKKEGKEIIQKVEKIKKVTKKPSPAKAPSGK